MIATIASPSSREERHEEPKRRNAQERSGSRSFQNQKGFFFFHFPHRAARGGKGFSWVTDSRDCDLCEEDLSRVASPPSRKNGSRGR